MKKEARFMRIETEYGDIEITANAIRKMVYMSAIESAGPVNISAKNWLEKIFSSDESKIKVEEDEIGNIKVDLFLEVEYGVKLPEVANALIEKVQSELKTYLNCESVDVNVHFTSLK